ncbi:MAG: tandem-95 repeat protein, partial [Polaromonas sp.]|nr:tandem-95 repeat protein [Polaromonas sp.]
FALPAGTFADVDLGDTLAYSALLADGTALPAWLSFSALTGIFSGTPLNANVGSLNVRVTATDLAGASASDIFVLTVANTNDAPALTGTQALLAAGTEDVAYTVTAADLLAGFSDVDVGAILGVSGLTASASTVTTNVDGSFTITQAANFNGPVSLSYSVIDGNGGAIAASQSYNLTAVSDAPVIAAIAAVTMSEDTVASGTAVGSDVDSALLTYTAGAAANGAVAINAATGAWTYTPVANFNGSDSFTVTVSDGDLTAQQVVNVTINPVNDAPVIAATAAATVAEESSVSGTAAGSDVDSALLTYTAGAAANGAVVINAATGAWTYTPVANFNGSDSFIVTVSDGDLTAQQVVSVTVNPVNDAPVIAATAAATVAEDSSVSGTAAGSDVDSALLTYAAGAATNGAVAINAATGAWTYTPALNFNGSDSFTVTVSDGDLTAQQVVSVTVNPVNDAPALTGPQALLVAGTEDVAYTVTAADLLAGFSDVDVGAILGVSGLTASAGTVTNNPDGSFTITPNLNFNGTMTLTYSVIDGLGGVLAANQTYSVAPVNDAPVIAIALLDQPAIEDAVFSFALPAGTFADVDLGDTLAYSALLADGTALPAWLSFSALTGAFSGTPLNANVGSLNVRVTATDLAGASASDIFVLTVVNTNDAPVLSGTQATLTAGIEDNLYTRTLASLLTGFSDVDLGAILSVSGLTASAGTVTSDGTNFTVDPTLNFNGTMTLNYNVIDGQGGSIAATQSFNLAAVNDPTQGAVTLSNLTPALLFTVSVSQNMRDVDGAIGPISYQWQSAAVGSLVWNNIAGATGTNFVPVTGGEQLRVVASYSVGGAATETMVSAAAVAAQFNTITGTALAETINGSIADDQIFGLASNDVIRGFNGNDRIVGGGGRDTLTGGAGADTFVLAVLADSLAGAGRRDIITDFTVGVDKLDFSGLDANTLAGQAGDQAFTLIGTSAFGGVAGQLRYTIAGGITLVEGDVNGDALADFQVQLNGNKPITAADVIM